MKLNKTHAIVLSTLLASGAAMSQTKAPEPDYTLSYNIGVTSDYRFRAISQTSTGPALQAGIDFAHKSGFYLGGWGSNISWIKDYTGATDGSLELDFYGGYKGEISKDLTFDIGLITYQYPSNTAPTNANTTEFYGALTYGPVTAKYSRSLGNFIANPDSTGSSYLEVAATFDLGNGFSLTPHAGRQWIPNVVNNAGNYTDLALTLVKDFGNGLAISVAAMGTNADKPFYTDTKGKYLADNAFVVGLKYSF
ncbi:MAG: TorF family putative porin [Rhodoferax sp.]